MARPRPRVSVIMAVHNCEDYVGEAIESIQAQTCEDWELLCVDDASTDDSGAIVERYAADDSRISVIRQEKNRGPAGTRNIALAEARGDFIAILDSDDIALPHRLETSLAAVEHNSALGVVSGLWETIDPNGEIIDRPNAGGLDNDAIRQRLLASPCPLAHSASMIRRDLMNKVGGYDERLQASEDYDLFLRLIGLCEFQRLGEVLVQYRRRPGQTSSRKNLALRLYADFAREQTRAALAGQPFDDQKHLRRIENILSGSRGLSRRAGWHLCSCALDAWKNDNPERARTLLARARGYWPLSPRTLLWSAALAAPRPVQQMTHTGYQWLRKLSGRRQSG